MTPTRNTGAPDTDPDQLHDQFNEVWGNPRGWRALTIVNHTSIGLRFTVTGAFFFLVGGLLAMLIRTQLALPGYELMEPDVYNRGLHHAWHGDDVPLRRADDGGAGGLPDPEDDRRPRLGIPAAVRAGLLLLPVRRADSAVEHLPRHRAEGRLVHVHAAVQFSAYAGVNSDFWLLGITFVEISAVSAGVELVVSILRTRTNGMALHKMPLYARYIW